MLKRPPIIIFLTSFVLFLTTLQAKCKSSPDWQDPRYIENAFIEVALKNEYKKTDFKIVKWLHPIHYRINYLSIHPTPFVEKLIQAHFHDLQAYTGLTIKPASHRKPNFNIFLTKDKYYAEVIKTYAHVKNVKEIASSNCMGIYRTNKYKEIVEATVVIPVDHALSKGLLPACIVEETTQVLGLPNDSDWVNPSIANDKSLYDLLTGLDYIMLKILYDPRLKPGMALRQSRPIIRKIIHDLEQKDEIEKASHYLRRGEFYRMLN